MPIRRRRYKRNARRAYVPSIYRRRSAFTSNYIRCKIDVVDMIGPFLSGTGGIDYAFAHGDGTNASGIYTISDMLSGNAQFVKLSTVFSLCKIKGISVELIPIGADKMITLPVCMAYFNSDLIGITYAQCCENPNSLMLDPNARKYKYISLLGNTGDWKPVGAGSFDGRFLLEQMHAMQGGSDNVRFTVKFSLFMIFKQALA